MNVAHTIPDKGNEIETLEKGSQMYRVHYNLNRKAKEKFRAFTIVV